MLSDEARAVLARVRAKRWSFGVRALMSPGPNPRLVVALGEAHLKFGGAAELGREVVEAFALRGVETFQAKDLFAGRALRPLVHVPRAALRALSRGRIKDSTIVDARQASHGHTVEIERTDEVPLALHAASAYMTAYFGTAFAQLGLALVRTAFPKLLPGPFALLSFGAAAFQAHTLLLVPAVALRRHRWSWVLHPMSAIVTARDTLMAEGTVRMLADYPDAGPALVIMGRAHLPGFERELVEKHGFERVELP